MPDPAQEIAVGGPWVERMKRRLWLFAIRVVRFPFVVLTLPLKQLHAEVVSLRSAAVESIAYVGIELRRLGDLIERGASSRPFPNAAESPLNGPSTGSVEIPFAFRSLAGVDPPGPVLVIGSRGRGLGASLAALGFDATLLDPDGAAQARSGVEVVHESLADWDAGGRRFVALLYLGDSDPNTAEIQRFGELLADDGVLVLARVFATPEASSADPKPPALAGGWRVDERLVVAGHSDEDWAPVGNGASPDSGVALIAARRAAG
jgi:hypothetical protein